MPINITDDVRRVCVPIKRPSPWINNIGEAGFVARRIKGLMGVSLYVKVSKVNGRHDYQQVNPPATQAFEHLRNLGTRVGVLTPTALH